MLIIAHRGASATAPENSLAAFRAAMECGANGVELDVHATVDGEIVVHHDAVAGGLRIADTPLDDVRAVQLANGEPVPTLAESLGALGPEMMVFVEVKTLDRSQDDAFMKVLADGPTPPSYHVHSFDHRIVRRLLRQNSNLVGGVLSTSYPVNPLIQLEQSDAIELWQQANVLDDELVAAVHAIEKRVIAWTVDDAEQMREFIDMGVDAICTNHPDVLRSLLQ